MKKKRKLTIGGYGKLVQRELEAQRQLVDYGAGTLGAFPPVVPSHYMIGAMVMEVLFGTIERSEHEPRRNSDHESRPEKNPRFRESGDSDEDEDDDRKNRLEIPKTFCSSSKRKRRNAHYHQNRCTPERVEMSTARYYYPFFILDVKRGATINV
ncbi:hypothetical protein Cgig2_020557 [Carnegiea gigantea]|uniref:Uncharacterized protein n=1 Tax=Carnegiea gigantea TaxID=171969 RepID=A0A9Q1JR81_9CARY|nr:hypothetical protein Cgig2_020557 [Carnegiea gigantea]